MAIFDVDGAAACEMCAKAMVDIVSSFTYRGKTIRLGLCWPCHRDSEHKIQQAVENQQRDINDKSVNEDERYSDE